MEHFFKKLYKVMSVVSKCLSVDVLCVLYICNRLYKIMSVMSKCLSLDVLCVLYICNRLYKIMSVMFKWLSVDILCVLFVNVCGPVVYGIISCSRNLWL
jgi:hypothetical protein